MDAAFSDEQQELRRALRDIAADRCSSAQLRAVIDSDEGYDGDLWRLLAGDLGLVGVAIPERYGGTGDLVAAAVVLEETGRGLLPVPMLGALVGAAVLARADPPQAELLTALAAGERVAVVVPAAGVKANGQRLTGTAGHALDAHLADLLVVAADDGLYVVPTAAPGVTVEGRRALDITRRQARVEFDGAIANRIGAQQASAGALDLLRVGLAMESLGVARRCLDLTVDYLRTRVQFGRPIGSFQALQHRAADLAVAVEGAVSTAYYAAWLVAEDSEELSVVAPLSLAVCGEAARMVTAETIQLHGGIGFTWEHDAHLYFKRATSNRLLLGDTHVQRGLVAARAGLGTAS